MTEYFGTDPLGSLAVWISEVQRQLLRVFLQKRNFKDLAFQKYFFPFRVDVIIIFDGICY